MMSICFSGIDGSGKTTQCHNLIKRFQEMGVETKFIHILSQGKTVGSKSQSLPLITATHRRLRDLSGKGVTRCFKLFIGLSYYLVDSWISHIFHKIKYRNNVVIYDRYFFDPLLIFASNFPRIPLWVIPFSRIIPQGNVTIIMEVPPEIAKQRKPEHPLDLLKRYHQLYRRLADILKVKIIDGTMNNIIVEKEVNQRCHSILEYLKKAKY